MKYIYSLSHSHLVSGQDPIDTVDTKFIGYFSSYESACDIENKYKKIIGFKDYPDGFYIEKVQIDYDDYDFI